jgi:hypothetical protein
MVIGPHGVNPANTDGADALVDAAFSGVGIGSNTQERLIDGASAQREFALRNNAGFVDCLPLFPDFTKANAEGYYGDSIHLNSKGQSAKRSWVMTQSNAGWILGSEGYRSGIRLGDAKLVGGSSRVTNPTIIAMNAANTAQVSITASAFRSGATNRPETEGMGFRTAGGSTADIFGYTTGSTTSLHQFSGTTIRPITNNTGQLGDVTKIYKKAYTNAIHTAYRSIAADATMLATDHTIRCTASPLTLTLLLAFGGDNDAYANQGRELWVVNTSGGDITIATTEWSVGNPQRINTASTYTLAAGSSVRLVAAVLGAHADYNWLAMP